MAIHAITGVMGSGKSYEAVSEKIAPALKSGRRVVTNVEGLNPVALSDYLSVPLADIQSRLVVVPYGRVSEAAFWYCPDSDQDSPSVVRPGDLVVLDEVWRYFNRGVRLPDDAMTFFRMHRHYVDSSTRLACDVVLINQSFRGIHQDIRDVVEVQFQCRKLKVLGRPQNYQVLVIEGNERKASHALLRSYSPRVFPLYSSYKGGSGVEAIDARQSVLSRPFFKFVLPLSVLAIGAGWWTLHSINYGVGRAPAAPVTAASPAVSAPAAPVQGATPAAPPAVASATAGAAPVSSSTAWRLVAFYKVADLPVAVLVDDKGRYKTITLASYAVGASADMSLPPLVDDRRISPASGSGPTYTTGGRR